MNDRDVAQVDVAAVVENAHVRLHADPVVPSHVDAGGAGDFNLAGDLGIGASHRHELVLRKAIERAAPRDRHVNSVFGEEHRPPSAGKLGVVLNQKQRSASLDVQRDVVLQLEHANAVVAGRDVDGAPAGGSAGVDGRLACNGGALCAHARRTEGLDVELARGGRRLRGGDRLSSQGRATGEHGAALQPRAPGERAGRWTEGEAVGSNNHRAPEL
jgi:hypothetical protein